MNRDVQTLIRDELALLADPVRAPQQQAYMKSAMPYYGVTLVGVRTVVRSVAVHARCDSFTQWQGMMWHLIETAERREEYYAALKLMQHKVSLPWARQVEALVLYRAIVEHVSWWDVVDDTAHLVEGVLTEVPDEAKLIIRGWSREEHLWVRRVSILSQLLRKDGTDRALLRYCIEGSVDDPQFFARKAIGWALRQYAKVSPDAAQWVVETVQDLNIAGLTRREALKHIGDPGAPR